MPAFKILTCDGGGIRGVIPAAIIAAIEARAGNPARELFDLIAGTSTGGIIACGLAAGLPASTLGDFYSQKGGAIFNRSLVDQGTNPAGVRCPRYDPAPLEAALLGVLGGTWLSEVPCDLAIPSYCMALPAGWDSPSTRTPWVFSTVNARKDPRYDFLLRDVARATSAAPTYFPLARITNRGGEAFAFADGGLFANNPAMVALTRAMLWHPGETYLAISLGTGALEAPFNIDRLESAGALEQLAPVLSMEMDGGMDETVAAMDAALGSMHVRINISLGIDPGGGLVDEAFDDASPANIAQLSKLAQTLIASETPTIDKLLEDLTNGS